MDAKEIIEKNNFVLVSYSTQVTWLLLPDVIVDSLDVNSIVGVE